MSVEAGARLITADELAALKIEGPFELVEGRIVHMSPTGMIHLVVVGRLIHALVEFVRPRDLGLVTSGEGGYWTRRRPDSVRAPDVAYLSHETIRRALDGKTTFCPGAPDLAVEVMSPDDTWEAVEAKVREYLSAGAKGVWVASPAGRFVRAYEPGGAARTYGEPDELDGGAALPGFRAPVAAIFRDLGAA